MNKKLYVLLSTEVRGTLYIEVNLREKNLLKNLGHETKEIATFSLVTDL